MFEFDWLLRLKRQGKAEAEVIIVVAIGCCSIVKRGEFWETASEDFFFVEVCESRLKKIIDEIS